jgi:hypothetical protein
MACTLSVAFLKLYLDFVLSMFLVILRIIVLDLSIVLMKSLVLSALLVILEILVLDRIIVLVIFLMLSALLVIVRILDLIIVPRKGRSSPDAESLLWILYVFLAVGMMLGAHCMHSECLAQVLLTRVRVHWNDTTSQHSPTDSLIRFCKAIIMHSTNSKLATSDATPTQATNASKLPPPLPCTLAATMPTPTHTPTHPSRDLATLAGGPGLQKQSKSGAFSIQLIPVPRSMTMMGALP